CRGRARGNGAAPVALCHSGPLPAWGSVGVLRHDAAAAAALLAGVLAGVGTPGGLARRRLRVCGVDPPASRRGAVRLRGPRADGALLLGCGARVAPGTVGGRRA